MPKIKFRNQQSLSRSFVSALRGIKHAAEERNFVIQSAIGLVAIALAFILNLSLTEKSIIIIFTALVLVIEIINSAFEGVLDNIIKEKNPEVARIKELMAAAVFIFSLAAFFLGLWIFGWAIFFR